LSAASRLRDEYCARVPRLESRGNSPCGKADVGGLSHLRDEYCARVPRLESRGNSPFGKSSVGGKPREMARAVTDAFKECLKKANV